MAQHRNRDSERVYVLMKTREDVPLAERARAVLVFLVVFLIFFPNPALPIGNSTGLQYGQLAILALLPLVCATTRFGRAAKTSLLLFVPAFVSAVFSVVVAQSGSPELVLKALLVQSVALLPLVVADAAVIRIDLRPIVTAACIAVLLHSALAWLQYVGFAEGKFPLLFLFQNPSFLQPSTEYALWNRRVTGLFPEPSALAASCGPWVLFMMGLGILRTRASNAVRPVLSVIAAIAGLFLILASGSGYAVVLMALIVVLALTGFLRRRAQWVTRVPALAVLTAVVAAWLLVSGTLQARLGSAEFVFWAARTASLRLGLTGLLQGPGELLLGLGPGLSPSWLASAANEYGFEGVSIPAIWSVQVRYIAETGFLGLIAVMSSVLLMVRAIVDSSSRVFGGCCLMAWAFAHWATTSYVDLAPPWAFMAVLLRWSELFPRSRRLGAIPDRQLHSQIT